MRDSRLSDCVVKEFFSCYFFKTTVLFLFFLFSMFDFITIVLTLCCGRRAYFKKLPYFL